MEPIQPIGPRERDIEPVLRVPPLSRDGGRERPGQHDHDEDEQPRRKPPEQPAPPDGEDGTCLIDVRV
jgi:hypothetical protein